MKNILKQFLKGIITLVNLFFIFNLCFGQGLNNDYQFDNEDLTNIFKMQGIHVFKFPFQLDKGEYISLSYYIYENEIEKERCDILEDIQIGLGLTMDHHLSRRDTTAFHRIYFMTQDDSLNIKVVVPGFSIERKIDISKVESSGCTASLNIDEKLPDKRDILSFYAYFHDSDKYQEYGFTRCPTGLPTEKMIEYYDFALIFFAERITKERAETILEEDYYKRKKEIDLQI